MTTSNSMKMAENFQKGWKALGKGEIAHYEKFLLFKQCFQNTYTADSYKQGLVWGRVKKCVEIMGKGKKYQPNIFSFSTMFHNLSTTNSVSKTIYRCSSECSFNSDQSNILLFDQNGYLSTILF